MRLPSDHPIWQYPPGVRSTIAREWLDISSRLAAIEKRLDAIQNKEPQNKPPNETSKKADRKDQLLHDLVETFGIEL